MNCRNLILAAGLLCLGFLVGLPACRGSVGGPEDSGVVEEPADEDGGGGEEPTVGEDYGDPGAEAGDAGEGEDGGDAGQQKTDTMRVVGRFLHDVCGEQVVLRGVNKMVVWVDWVDTPRDGMPMYVEIARTGANVVRIVWVTGENTTAEELDRAITACIGQQMIPMIELHDQTCVWSHAGIQSLTDFWTRPEIVAVIQKHQEHLLVNFGNEIGDWNVTDDQFKAEYESAVGQMRAAGIRVPIIIDGTKCGQDVDVLLRNGPYLIQADPEHNLMFSVHMWWTDNNPQRVTDAIHASVDADLPLMVGEFAHKGVGCSGAIPYQTIIAECQEHQIGYLPWSWDHENGDCSEHSMTTDDNETYETLWGWALEVSVTDPNSIQNTSVRPAYIRNGTCSP